MPELPKDQYWEVAKYSVGDELPDGTLANYNEAGYYVVWWEQTYLPAEYGWKKNPQARWWNTQSSHLFGGVRPPRYEKLCVDYQPIYSPCLVGNYLDFRLPEHITEAQVRATAEVMVAAAKRKRRSEALLGCYPPKKLELGGNK